MAGSGARQRPFINARFAFPTLGNQVLEVELLVDTGADRTVLAPSDAIRLRTNFATLTSSTASGIGGRVGTRIISAILTLGHITIPMDVALVVPSAVIGPMPSLLGRDVLAHFALFFEERTRRVLLLEPSEASLLRLPI